MSVSAHSLHSNGSEAGSTSRRQPSSSRRVVTTPSWARNLPPDELDFLDDLPAPPSSNSPPRRLQQRRSLSSFMRAAAASGQSSSSVAAGSATTPYPVTGNNGASASSDSSPYPDSSPLAPLSALEPARSNSDVRRAPLNHGADRWWTFTLPSKYMDRLHDHANGQVEEGEKSRDRTSEDEAEETEEAAGKHMKEKKDGKKGSDVDLEKQAYSRQMSMSMGARLLPSNVFSLNQTQTPGWSAPWTPFHRDENHHSQQDPFTIAQAAAAAERQSKRTRFETFILHNPFAPLVFRIVNLALNVCTLALACHIRIQERNADVIGVIGSSTLFTICVSPLAILHIFVTLYIEYFGSPIGIWSISTKMFHTLIELVFICLWSSILSLALDDLFTSSLECTAFTPYSRYNMAPINVGDSGVEGTLADSICSQQIAEVVLIFLSVALYIAVLVVSLFRIMAKVVR